MTKRSVFDGIVCGWNGRRRNRRRRRIGGELNELFLGDSIRILLGKMLEFRGVFVEFDGIGGGNGLRGVDGKCVGTLVAPMFDVEMTLQVESNVVFFEGKNGKWFGRGFSGW